MKREIKNYLFMGMGFTTLFLLIIWDLMAMVNELLYEYNQLVDTVNSLTDLGFVQKTIYFFGYGMNDIVWLKDTVITILIINTIFMVILHIRWNIIDHQEGIKI